MTGKLRLTAPSLSARVSLEVTASTLAKLLASEVAVCKADLVRHTGLSRTTIDAGVRRLDELGIVRWSGQRPTPGRGRPADRLDLNPEFGLVLVADCGAHTTRLAIHDIGQNQLADDQLQLDIELGPVVVLDRIIARFEVLLEGLQPALPRVVVIGLPGPVDNRTGTVVRPPIMPGWDGFPIAQYLRDRLNCAALLENDVNLRALGESRALPEAGGPLLYVKVGTGIGGGLVTADGQLLHGADGAAGDIGHVRVTNADVRCVCGNTGCLEAVASAAAVIKRLTDRATTQVTGDQLADLERLIRDRDPRVLGLIRDAAGYIGEAVANLVHFFNPARIVIGGALAHASDDLLAGVRTVVYQRALPLATRNLVLALPVLGEASGVAGGVVLGIEYVLEPELIDQPGGIVREVPSDH